MTMIIPSSTGYGAVPQFFEPRSGTRFEFHTPFARPDLWRQYLDGAAATYRAYGVEEVLGLDATRSGLSTTLFAVGLSVTGKVVAGVRFQGPILHPDEAHVSVEFAGSPGEKQVRSVLAERIPEGVIEFKAGWVEIDHDHSDALSDAIARSFAHGMQWLNVRHGCCSAATYATRRWESSGGRIMEGLEAIPYPSDRYQTTLLWWDRDRLASDADPRQWHRLEVERRQIERSVTGMGIEHPDLLATA